MVRRQQQKQANGMLADSVVTRAIEVEVIVLTIPYILFIEY